MSKNSLASLQSRLSAALQDRTEILEGYLFGSQATGRAQAHSDIDVALAFIETMSPLAAQLEIAGYTQFDSDPSLSTLTVAQHLGTTLRAGGLRAVQELVPKLCETSTLNTYSGNYEIGRAHV